MNIRNGRIRVEGLNPTDTAVDQFDRVRKLAREIESAGGFVDGGAGDYRFAMESSASILSEEERKYLEAKVKSDFLISLRG